MGKKPPLRLPHPRNIYREKPIIKELALQYPDFRKYAIQSLDGRVTMNFKDKNALCALTKVLLKKDFNLTIDIPPDRLVPTVPLRLNYLLWIEDLLEVLQRQSNSSVYGIDIGTGASCIYALLAARKNGYHMSATEVDETNFTYASNNVASNNLQNLVQVKKVNEDTFLCGALDSDLEYDFCMCNPPFFNIEDQGENESEGKAAESSPMIKGKNRTGHRLPPKSVPTGSMVELATPGGEVAFIQSIINDSIILKNKIKIYTSMVGHRSNVDTLIARLVKLDGLSKERVTVSPFYQGNVTRWGIAWTFDNNIHFTSTELQNKNPAKSPICHTFENVKLDYAIARVNFLLDRIQIIKKVIQKRGDEYSLEIKSYKESWKNQRKRRREEQRKIKAEELKKIKVCDSDCNNGVNDINAKFVVDNLSHDNPSYDNERCDEVKCLLNGSGDSHSVINEQDSGCQCNRDDKTQFVLEAVMLLKTCNENSVLLRLMSTGGIGGWNAVHQILTYLKNHWNRDL